MATRRTSAATGNPTVFSPPRPTTGRLRWGHLFGSAAGLAAASAAVAEQPGPVVVLGADANQCHDLAEQLAFFAPSDLPVRRLRAYETLPYEAFAPHQDIVADRLTVLGELLAGRPQIVVAEVMATLTRLPPRSFVRGRALRLEAGERVDLPALRRALTEAGYRSVGQVMEKGEFAVRGSLLDIYPSSESQPLRIDLFDDEVESIRSFDTRSQRSGETLPRMRLLPAREYPLDAEAISLFRKQFRGRFDGDPTQATVYRDVSDGNAGGGQEAYLPLFFEGLERFFDYLPEDTLLLATPEALAAPPALYEEITQRYEQLRHDLERPLLSPDELFLPAQEMADALDGRRLIEMGRFATGGEGTDFATAAPPSAVQSGPQGGPAEKLRRLIESFDGSMLLVAESPGRRESLLEMLRDQQLHARRVDDWSAFIAAPARLAATVAPLQEGLLLSDASIAVVAENQLFDRTPRRRETRKARDPATLIRDLTDLAIGAPVVHEAYGIGRYAGLMHLAAGGTQGEYLMLTYAGDDKLYVPVHSLHLISRYTGSSPEHAPLHRLGSDQWEKARRKAARKVRDVAAELLELYARRAARTGHSLALPAGDYAAFAAGFGYELTADQDEAIEQIIDEMTSLKPMDRLVCGDVGFGKTEVALRAAFIAAQNGKQVAVLVPTTLLAQQHGVTFRDRFADWPLRVEVLSRLRQRSEVGRILEGCASGTVDIVIGTHRLLQKDVNFKELGLVIIDEEHRFGVRHKERLKSLRAEVDVLTLTATPIPRTLNQAMGGLRDLSLIATPPAARLAIKTFVTPWNEALIRDACLREIKRGGQIYFLHNSVQTIEKKAQELGDLVPEAHIEIGHGQMRERDLERVMQDFSHRRFNLLVCTTIVESGIDIPSANTIIIDRADRFGLAQLHQLRGRVGRSNRRAFAYLITPPTQALSADARKRLEAIASMEDLGAGFALASHDLEIRGAGELLGEEQSGQIQEIGFALYMDLLDRAVESLRHGREPDLDELGSTGAEIDLAVPAFFPDDYLPDVHMRLVQYKRIAGADSDEALRELKVEMIDRFGLLPEEAMPLFDLAAVRLRARSLGIVRIEAGSTSGRIVFGKHATAEPDKLIALVAASRGALRFEGEHCLRFRADLPSPADRFAHVRELLAALGAAP